ncbi:peptidase M24, structural domain-containing protein [Melampsora americana]|nr:peptidase M24, structural domain-containing protein [Melampsora americana]
MASQKPTETTESSKPVDQPTSTALPVDILTKYKTAAEIASKALKLVISKAVKGSNLLSLCQEGDTSIEEGCASVYNKDKKNPTKKGIAFPCTISINNVLCHFTPLPTDAGATQELQDGDVVKIMLGSHIDGYASIIAETVVVGASATAAVTGPKADLLAAAYNATELALRLVKPGAKNWDVTDGVQKLLKEYNGSIKGMEGMVSHQHDQSVIDGKKTINLFPTTEQHRDKDSTFVFEEGDVFGLDVLLTTGGDTKSKAHGDRTSIFQKTTSSYQLKMKTSRATYGEIVKKAGAFPFTLRKLEDQTKARMGVKECVQHGLLKEFEVTTTSDSKDFTAQYFVTFVVTKNGASRITPQPHFYTGQLSEVVKSEVKVQDEELSAILARGLKPKKVKKQTNGEAKEVST